MSEQIEIITDLLVDFDEMGFCPTTSCPDPDAYAIEWRNKMTNALKGYRTELAREIFEEIEKALSSMKYNANTPRKTIKVEELKEQVDWVLHEVVPNRIAELKKKYESEGADDE